MRCVTAAARAATLFVAFVLAPHITAGEPPLYTHMGVSGLSLEVPADWLEIGAQGRRLVNTSIYALMEKTFSKEDADKYVGRGRSFTVMPRSEISYANVSVSASEPDMPISLGTYRNANIGIT